MTTRSTTAGSPTGSGALSTAKPLGQCEGRDTS